MNHLNQKRLFVWLLAPALVVAIGCQSKLAEDDSPPSDESPTAFQESPIATNVPETDKRKTVAMKAKDALVAKLSGRLMEVLQSQGASAAIDVCSQQAVQIAAAVGSEYSVAIGRTSFKLRNPANAPRDWVKPFVEKRADTPQQVQLDNGSLGALFPIHLDVKCLMCHGQPDEILDAVKPQLAERYPNDAATGFQQGELRGWIWVEVPGA